ncbi:hypothetical protein K488DRAFT_60410, partial [Vararia minispora EC-137]
IITHTGAHIRYDPRLTTSRRGFPREPCGMCARGPESCQIFLTKTSSASKASPQVDSSKSTCPHRFRKFKYASAAVSSGASPCSNVPLVCELCGPNKPAIWRYNFYYHLLTVHPLANLQDYKDIWTISEQEHEAMGLIWRKIGARRPPPVNKKAAKLTVSQALSLSAALHR